MKKKTNNPQAQIPKAGKMKFGKTKVQDLMTAGRLNAYHSLRQGIK